MASFPPSSGGHWDSVGSEVRRSAGFSPALPSTPCASDIPVSLSRCSGVGASNGMLMANDNCPSAAGSSDIFAACFAPDAGGAGDGRGGCPPTSHQAGVGSASSTAGGYNASLQSCMAALQRYMADYCIHPEEKEAVWLIGRALEQYAVARMRVGLRLEEGRALQRRRSALEKAVESAAASFRATSVPALGDNVLLTPSQQPALPNGPVGEANGQRGRGRVDVDLAECRDTLARVEAFFQDFKELGREYERLHAAPQDAHAKFLLHEEGGRPFGFPVTPPQEEKLSLEGRHLLEDLQAAANVCAARLQECGGAVSASCAAALRAMREDATSNRLLTALQGLCSDVRDRLAGMRIRIARLGSSRVEEASRLDERLAVMDSYDPTMGEHEGRRRKIDTELLTVKGWLEATVQVQATADQLHEKLRLLSGDTDHDTLPASLRQSTSAGDRASTCWAVSTPSATTAAATIEECRLSSVRSSWQETHGRVDSRSTYPQLTSTAPPIARVAGTTVMPQARGVGKPTACGSTDDVAGAVVHPNTLVCFQPVENVNIGVSAQRKGDKHGKKDVKSCTDDRHVDAPEGTSGGDVSASRREEDAAVAVGEGGAGSGAAGELESKKAQQGDSANKDEDNAAGCHDCDDTDDADSQTSLFHPSAFSGGDRKRRRRCKTEKKSSGCINTFASFFRAVIKRAVDLSDSEGDSQGNGDEHGGPAVESSDDDDDCDETEPLHKKARLRLW